MRLLFALLAVVALTGIAPASAETAPGKLTGGEVYHLPQWFKSSFLDFQSDLDEAREAGKHVMVFMHLDECPYCARMLRENFVGGGTRDFTEKHFDVIGINVRGDLEVTWIDGFSYTERELSDHLNQVATPTIVFLDLDGNKVLQLNGYRDPRALKLALEYVQGKRYRDRSFADYLAAQERPVLYTFRAHPQLVQTTYFKGFDKPLAVLFEDRYCAECDPFHDNTLNHDSVLAALSPFLFARFDTESQQPIVDLDGTLTTAGKWVEALGLTYRPALVLFNEGREMYRADGRLYHQHLTEALRYVAEGYKNYATISEFKAAYREEMLQSGVDVDFAE